MSEVWHQQQQQQLDAFYAGQTKTEPTNVYICFYLGVIAAGWRSCWRGRRACIITSSATNYNQLQQYAVDTCFVCCRLEELLEVKEGLQKQLEAAQGELEAAAGQLADSRKKGEELAGQLKTAEVAKALAEKVSLSLC
jgi:hypothetical protein